MHTSLLLGHSNFLYLEGENTKSNFNCLLTSSNVRSRSSSSFFLLFLFVCLAFEVLQSIPNECMMCGLVQNLLLTLVRIELSLLQSLKCLL